MSDDHATVYHRLDTVRNYREIHMQAWHYIEENRDKRVTLTDFVTQSGFSMRQVQRALAWYGTSWQVLLREVRMNYAKVLLTHTSKKIGEVAKQVGYHHPQFSRVFKAEEGMRPEEYRQWIQSRLT